MLSRVGLVRVAASVVSVGALLASCANSHSPGGDGGAGDQQVVFDGELQDLGFVDSALTDGGSVDLGPDMGRMCLSAGQPAGDDVPGAPIIIPPEMECRTTADCFGGTQCFGASDPICGICQLPERECENDGECGAGSWCRAGRPNCCGGVDTVCSPDCGAGGTPCEDGEICDTDTGRCERNGCLFLDFACPQNFDCDPERPDAEVTGCARRECDMDSDCDCGFCVTGTCESTLGTCSFPAG